MGEIHYLDLDEQLPQLRLLQDYNTTAASSLTDTEVIRSTVAVYVPIFVALFLLFLLVRPCHPQAYNPKKSFPALHVPVAEDPHGRLSWMWEVFDVPYEDIREQCGMDAASMVRILEMGVKLSLVGVFNSLFLAPVYSLMGDAVAAAGGEDDPVKAVSLSNLEQGQSAAVATTVAAYIFFVALMHWVDKDFEWFTYHRHAFLSKRRVQNYSLFLSGLPPEMQTNGAVEEYFAGCFGDDAVADVHVALVIPNLEKKVAKRKALIPKLEHAINVLTVKGETPMHKTKFGVGERVESVPAYSKEIEDLNEDISKDIDCINAMQLERDRCKGTSLEEDVEAPTADGTAEPLLAAETASEVQKDVGTTLLDSVRPTALADTVLSGAVFIKTMIAGEDGAPRNAAFVSLSNLTSTNLARQAVHNQEPWFCVPTEPPMPDLVNWKNVGKANASKQIGELISLALTTLLCIFWTIPVGVVASFSSVDKLTELLPFLKAPVQNYEWFANFMALLAPLILVVFISLLPYFILAIIKFEGLIEIETMQHPSLFSKLAAFTIIQTFFISTIAGTISQTLNDVWKDPSKVLQTVSAALPARSAYFIQIIVVQNFLSLGIELLRISPVVTNALRKVASNALGHNLTEKERNETFMGLRSLDDPQEYYFGREIGSKIILLQMVLYVYGCMAPITSYFTLIIFGLLAMGYRHQFIYVYPIANDSGGKLWINFQRLSITYAIVAEIILFVVLTLKATFVAAGLMVPLIVCTILFDLYFKRRHYSVTRYLPLGDCAVHDHSNESQGMTNEWLKDAYLQPALKERAVLPQNCPEIVSVSGQRGQGQRTTPSGDEAAMADDYKEKGNSYMSSKEYELALEQYSRAIDMSPSGPSAHIYYSNRAAALSRLGDYDAAVEDCKKSIELEPTYEKAHVRLGLGLSSQGDYQGAVAAYEKALDLNPTNGDCFDYMLRAKERLGAETREESIEVEPPNVCGDGGCWGPENFGKSQSPFGPSLPDVD